MFSYCCAASPLVGCFRSHRFSIFSAMMDLLSRCFVRCGRCLYLIGRFFSGSSWPALWHFIERYHHFVVVRFLVALPTLEISHNERLPPLARVDHEMPVAVRAVVAGLWVVSLHFHFQNPATAEMASYCLRRRAAERGQSCLATRKR